MNRWTALDLLGECRGDEIWSVEYCRKRKVPESWIERLSDCFESGFDHDKLTIYVEDRVTNQYAGIRDVDLAVELGRFLGLDVEPILQTAFSRQQVVAAIQEAVEEG